MTALIPARAGSKRYPRKNFVDLCGKPLVSWTIEAALRSRVFTRIVLSSDALEARHIADKYGIYFHDRSLELSTDNASIMDLFRSMVDTNILVDPLTMILQPTSPLRTECHIRDAYSQYIRYPSETTSMVSVYDHSSAYCKSLRSIGQFVEPAHQQFIGTESHLFPHYFAQNGAIYLVSNKTAANFKTFLYPSCVPYYMDYFDSIDIDSKQEFKVAELLLGEQLRIKSSKIKK